MKTFLKVIITVAVCTSFITAQTFENHVLDLVIHTADMVLNSTLQLKDIQGKLKNMEAMLVSCQECTKHLESFQNASETAFEEISESLDNMATRIHLQDLKNLLAKDECQAEAHNCSENAACMDTVIGHTCFCHPGYTGDGYTCHDVDECSSENLRPCGLNEMCDNTPGSYRCTCADGFERVGDTCQDVDECGTGVDRCHRRAHCTNTIGSYTCSCKAPFSGDGYTCDGISCEYPSMKSQTHGCITLATGLLDWNEAYAFCNRKEMRLLEGIQRWDLIPLRNHFKILAENTTQAWVGFRKGHWLTSKEAVPIEVLAVNEGTLETGCGFFDMRATYDFGLWDHPCTGFRYHTFCQYV